MGPTQNAQHAIRLLCMQFVQNAQYVMPPPSLPRNAFPNAFQDCLRTHDSDSIPFFEPAAAFKPLYDIFGYALSSVAAERHP